MKDYNIKKIDTPIESIELESYKTITLWFATGGGDYPIRLHQANVGHIYSSWSKFRSLPTKAYSRLSPVSKSKVGAYLLIEIFLHGDDI